MKINYDLEIIHETKNKNWNYKLCTPSKQEKLNIPNRKLCTR